MVATRKNIMLGTAGHVDHGKSALVKMLTGCETDTLREEKERGLTIDLGFARCQLADERIVGVVDVPGHVDFIRNMVAGAHGIDVVILVVAADDGIMPQTREHLQILSLMGLRHGLVGLTKVDLVDTNRRDAVVRDVRSLLAGTSLADVAICPMSNLTGEGFDRFFEALNTAVAACQERPCTGIFRVWIEDVFSLRGAGTVITGIPSSGEVRVGDTLRLLPGGVSARVRRMQVYGEDASEGRAGECVALNLPEIAHDQARRGMLLCSTAGHAAVSMAEGELRLLDSVRGEVQDLLEVQAHVGTASTTARVAFLETGSMTAGQRQLIQLRFTEPVPVTVGERFVLRANLGGPGQTGLVTIGGGRLAALTNVRLRRNKRWTLEMLRARLEALDDAERWCELMLAETSRSLSVEALEARTLLRGDELEAVLARLENRARVVRLSTGEFVHSRAIDATARRLLTTLESFHGANPQRAGLGREELFSSVGAEPDIGHRALALLLARGQVQSSGAVYAKAGWQPKVPDQDQRLVEELGAAFQRAGWAGPTAVELVESLRQPLPRIEKALRLLSDRGILVALAPPFLVHRDALEAAKLVVLGLFRSKRSFSTMEFRDALGVSRKYAVPLLDHLDRLRFTVRSGHDRTPGAEAKKLLELKQA